MHEQKQAVEARRDAHDREVHQHPPLLLVHGAQVQRVQRVLPEGAHELQKPNKKKNDEIPVERRFYADGRKVP